MVVTSISKEKENEIILDISQGMSITPKQVNSTLKLLVEGNTVPFISRYRKEVTGSLDETQIRAIEEQFRSKTRLILEKTNILEKIREQGKLTPELEKSILSAASLGELQEIYRPYKKKKKTRGQVAREKGLEPLAEIILNQEEINGKSVSILAEGYLNEEFSLTDIEEVLAGARDIIAEDINNNIEIREIIKNSFFKTTQFTTKVSILHKMDIEEDPTSNKVRDGKKYEKYFGGENGEKYEENALKTPPHRLLAMIRGDREGYLNFKVIFKDKNVLSALEEKIIVLGSKLEGADTQLTAAIQDCWKRLLGPSMSREIKRNQLENAEEHSVKLFTENLKQLLLTSPVKARILGVDPAYRTGCKFSAISETGTVLETGTIYPHPPQRNWEESKEKLKQIIKKHNIPIVAIGNGTASRETEILVAEIAKGTDQKYIIVSEAGASVYSASDIAREEFPNLDVSIRGAISIARRLQDPLAELVKIDPKSLGVGQYQHDLSGLSFALKDVVTDSVNLVGVDLNTASKSLLKYVSGISNLVANNIIEYRQENGAIIYREELKQVKGVGVRTFEQASGFLRILESPEPFDNSPIHPESYKLAEDIIKLVGFTKSDLSHKESRKKLQEQIKLLNPKFAAKQLKKEEKIETISDIILTLQNPYRDPREDFAKPLLKTEVLSIEDLSEGMEVEGTINNVVDFGCFVDIGVKSNGLIHISEMSNTKFIKHPRDAGLKVGDIVKAQVKEIDLAKKRISLTLRKKT
ncbi:MAG: Tex-like N-terminal domain-containing protein, partial [Candidatus Hodarchaeales archaeon]